MPLQHPSEAQGSLKRLELGAHLSDTVHQCCNLGFEVTEILHVQGEMVCDVRGTATATRLTMQARSDTSLYGSRIIGALRALSLFPVRPDWKSGRPDTGGASRPLLPFPFRRLCSASRRTHLSFGTGARALRAPVHPSPLRCMGVGDQKISDSITNHLN